MKFARILSALAVFAAAGMVLTGCDSPDGVGNGYDEAVSAAAPALRYLPPLPEQRQSKSSLR